MTEPTRWQRHRRVLFSAVASVILALSALLAAPAPPAQAATNSTATACFQAPSILYGRVFWGNYKFANATAEAYVNGRWTFIGNLRTDANGCALAPGLTSGYYWRICVNEARYVGLRVWGCSNYVLVQPSTNYNLGTYHLN